MTTEQRKLLEALAADHRTYEDDAEAIRAALAEIDRLTAALASAMQRRTSGDPYMDADPRRTL